MKLPFNLLILGISNAISIAITFAVLKYGKLHTQIVPIRNGCGSFIGRMFWNFMWKWKIARLRQKMAIFVLNKWQFLSRVNGNFCIEKFHICQTPANSHQKKNHFYIMLMQAMCPRTRYISKANCAFITNFQYS